MIKLICLNCNYFKEVDFLEYANNFCPICNNMLYVDKKDLIEYVIKEDVNYHLNIYFKELGIEGTIELVERNKDYPLSKYYVERLKELGFKLDK